jgi:hypothetical protein
VQGLSAARHRCPELAWVLGMHWHQALLMLPLWVAHHWWLGLRLLLELGHRQAQPLLELAVPTHWVLELRLPPRLAAGRHRQLGLSLGLALRQAHCRAQLHLELPAGCC